MTQKQIEGTFTLAEIINANCPESREKSIAFTQLQSAIQFANAAIAINEEEG